jgi:hypothetical protein
LTGSAVPAGSVKAVRAERRWRRPLDLGIPFAAQGNGSVINPSTLARDRVAPQPGGALFRPRWLALLRALARRLLFVQRQVDLLERPIAPGRVLRVEHTQRSQPRPPAPLVAPRAGLVITDCPQRAASAVAQAMRLLGIRPAQATSGQAAPMLRRARDERWPVVALELAAIPEAPGLTAVLRSYVHSGGCLLVTGVEPALHQPLRELCRELQVEVPGFVERQAAGEDAVVYPADQAAFSRELAGMALEGADPGPGLHTTGGAVLARSVGPQPATVVWEARSGDGSLILSVGASRLAARPLLSLESRTGITFLTPLMTLRRAYGEAVWRPPFPLANFTVDDPLLRVGLLGLYYPHLLEQGLMHGYHVSVATEPGELELAQPGVTDLLLARPDRLTACYQGNDHAGHALRQDAERGRAFAARTGLALDRVVVFPGGIGPEVVLPQLQQLGFLASFSSHDGLPRGEAAAWLGLRPAAVECAGFPLLGRRSLRDRNLALDIFVGRPAVAFAHRRDCDAVLADMSDQARRLNGMARVNWCGLEQIARHAYLQRRLPDGGWQVLMTGNEACLHNPGPERRRYRVTRPQLPPGALLASRGHHRGARELELAVLPGETVVVSVVNAGEPGLVVPRATTGPCRLS